jgi:Leucine-rich repeat (LRR) protein
MTYAALPISPTTRAEINENPSAYSEALALEMDESLYNAIFSGYAEIGTPKLDANSDGRISLSEAGNRIGAIQLGGKGITGTLRGIRYLTEIKQLHLYENDLEGEIPAEIGDLSNLTSIHLGSNNLKGTIPSTIGNLGKCSSFNIEANKIS